MPAELLKNCHHSGRIHKNGKSYSCHQIGPSKWSLINDYRSASKPVTLLVQPPHACIWFVQLPPQEYVAMVLLVQPPQPATEDWVEFTDGNAASTVRATTANPAINKFFIRPLLFTRLA